MATLSINVTSGHIETYEALLLQLGDPSRVGEVERVELLFGDLNQIFPATYALLAAYLGRVRGNVARPLVLRRFGANPHSARLERFMDSIGFLDAIVGKGSVRREGTGVLPLLPITAETNGVAIAEDVIEMVTESATGGNQPTRDAKETIFVLVSELIENCQIHSATDRPALLCGQLSAQKRKLELCLVDTGVGVQASLGELDDKETKARVKRGESLLGIALEPGISCKGPAATGYGLFVASEAAARTRGLFRLTSGGESVIVSREGEKVRTHAPWHGAVVNLMLNITRPGSIAEVYRELPRTRGDHDRVLAK